MTNPLDRIAEALEEVCAGSQTDALRTLQKGRHEMSCILYGMIPPRTEVELTMRFIELAQRAIELYQLDDAKKNLQEAHRLARRTVALERVEAWK